MNVLLDTNILIDYLTDREPFCEYSNEIFEMIKNFKISGMIAAHSVTNLWYILRKDYNRQQRKQMFMMLFDFFEISAVDKDKLFAAVLNDKFEDFEDCVQVECAFDCGADYIITRNIQDFVYSKIPPVTPEEFVKLVV